VTDEWTTITGRTIKIADMDDGHLTNAFAMMRRKGFKATNMETLGLGVELLRRKLGLR
jgi:hypothetical protein